MTLDELLTTFTAEYGDLWPMLAFDRFLYLHRACREHEEEYKLLRQWVEGVIEKGMVSQQLKDADWEEQ